jgi:hypothetical protein
VLGSDADSQRRFVPPAASHVVLCWLLDMSRQPSLSSLSELTALRARSSSSTLSISHMAALAL